MKSAALNPIDHLLTYVTSLDEATALFQRMGFRLSPVSRIDAMGISNRLVLMRSGRPDAANYIELMSPHDRSRLAAPMAAVLSGANGIGSMVLATAAIEDLARTIADAGFAPPTQAHVRREWPIPGEASVFPEFDVLLPFDAPLRFNACSYRNVELYAREQWLDHPNGARRLSAVYAVAPRPFDFMYFDRILGVAAEELHGGGLRWRTGEVRLEILTPAAALQTLDLDRPPPARPHYLGYEIEVADLAALRVIFDTGRVPYRTAADGRIHIEPQTGLGNHIAFTGRLGKGPA